MDERIPRISVDDTEDRHSVASLNVAPWSSRGGSSRRPSSVMSNLSSSGHRASSTSTSFSSLLPNAFTNSHNRLGANSIADLVDSVVPGSTPPPGRRSGTVFFKPPTSSDIPSVKLTPTPKIANSELLKFTTEIARDFDEFYMHQMSKRATSESEDSISVSALSDETDTLSQSGTITGPGETPSGSGSRSPRFDLHAQSQSPINPLSSIPEVFFEQDSFQLDNPKIFEAVSEQMPNGSRQHLDQRDVGNSLLNNSAILQEKLSWHIDTVELHLIKEISNASQSFFSTLGDLQSINSRTSECLQSIRHLRQELQQIDKNVALKGLEQLKQGMVVHNVDTLLSSLAQLKLIIDRTSSAETLLEDDSQENGAERCLDTLDAIEAAVKGDSSNKLVKGWVKESNVEGGLRLIDMRSVNSLNDVREHLRSLRTKAGDSYSRSFTKFLIDDLNTYIDNADKTETLNRLGRVLERDRRVSYERTPRTSLDEQSAGGYASEATTPIGGNNHIPQPNANGTADTNAVLRSKLLAQLEGLARSNNVVNAFNAYKEAVLKLGKNIVRMYLPTRDNDDSISISSASTTSRSVSERTMSLGTALRNMTNVEAQTMIINIYTSLSDLYRRLTMQQKLLLDLTSSLSTDTAVLALDVRDVVQDVISNSESYMVKILRARKDQFTRQNLQMFMNFYTLNGVYLTNCEALCGDPCRNLNVLLGSMIKQFLGSFAASRESELAKCLDQEIWKETEVTKSVQQTVDNLVKSADEDPEPWVSALKEVLNVDVSEKSSGVSTPRNGTQIGDKPPVDKKVLPKNIFVDNSSFIVTKSAMEMVRYVEEYLQLCVLLPHLSQETASDLASLLRRYNSRATQLVLQAGATRTGTLKHITAKHLSLSSESMHIMIALMPYIKSCIQRHLPGGTTYDIGEFDTIAMELRDHRQEIHDKFVSLMSDKMRYHCEAISKIDWDITEKAPISGSASERKTEKSKDQNSEEENKGGNPKQEKEKEESQPSTQPPAPHAYAVSISKETTILVKIITRLLPRETAVHITSLIFDTYKRLLIDTYTQAKIHTAMQKHNMLRDIDYLRENLGTLEGAGNALQVIWENVNAMVVDDDALGPRASSEKSK